MALINALLDDRPVYFLDELAADQDPAFRRRFYHEVLPNLRAAGKTAIVISHDLSPLLDRPYGLFGHSLGALVWFELARILSQKGLPPAHLFVSGKTAPQRMMIDRKKCSLPDDSDLIKELRDLNGTPPGILENLVRDGLVLAALALMQSGES